VRAMDAMPLYQLSSTNARWIGAELRDIELYLELTSRPETIEVGGLLTTLEQAHGGTKIRDVVVIAPASVARKRSKPVVAEPSDAAAPAPGLISGAVSGPVGPTSNGAVTPDAATDDADPAAGESETSKP